MLSGPTHLGSNLGHLPFKNSSRMVQRVGLNEPIALHDCRWHSPAVARQAKPRSGLSVQENGGPLDVVELGSQEPSLFKVERHGC
jgi:hypothetical protein